jgi:hypothetical protein
MLKRFSAALLLVGLLSGVTFTGLAEADWAHKCKPDHHHCDGA